MLNGDRLCLKEVQQDLRTCCSLFCGPSAGPGMSSVHQMHFKDYNYINRFPALDLALWCANIVEYG